MVCGGIKREDRCNELYIEGCSSLSLEHGVKGCSQEEKRPAGGWHNFRFSRLMDYPFQQIQDIYIYVV